jgi:hypothetical protein
MSKSSVKRPAQSAAQKWAALHERANAAGLAAAEAAVPVPIVVGKSLGLSNEFDPSAKKYFVSEGLCGFAYVLVSGRSGFGRWAKAQKLGYSDSYRGCFALFVRTPSQSVERKEAYARAYVGVLEEAGLEASYYSRLD